MGVLKGAEQLCRVDWEEKRGGKRVMQSLEVGEFMIYFGSSIWKKKKKRTLGKSLYSHY